MGSIILHPSFSGGYTAEMGKVISMYWILLECAKRGCWISDHPS